MFTWSIAKSAEGMFSRWAIKRVCKFLLKKKLGKFILGDIDLNQLDVQLSAGTIQLSDLALNVDYINQKFRTSAVVVKEGSVGSLIVTMPWKDGGCRIEVDELEIVLAPRRAKVSEDEFETCDHTKNDNNSFSHVFRKLDNETANNGVTNAAVDVHEGVKTIAKMVKWLLTSFHVKIKKLIVAFDPLLEEENNFDPLLEEENKNGLDRTMVLRINEIECGTHISEDASSSSFTRVYNFLGLSRLTNFVKFQGAVLELLHMDGLDYQSPSALCPETTVGDCFSGYPSSGAMTTIITGEKGGFSGNLKLSIPWKNGSLDIRKVDADLHIEPLEIRLQPSTILCFIFMWDLLKGIGLNSKDRGHPGPSNSSSVPSSCTLSSDRGLLSNEGFVPNCCSMETEPVSALLSESHLISDWVSKIQKDRNEEEPDFGASVDQFFECFDGLRNSQSALGNSGMWNWTCSVFSAITAASNLASGSLHVTSEQQHVETNFNATMSKISVLFSFFDEDQKESSKMKDDKTNTAFPIGCICTQFVDLFLVFQVCPQDMNLEFTVHQIQLTDHLCSKNDSVSLEAHGRDGNSESESALIAQMQDGVQSALRTFQEPSKDRGLDYRGNCTVDISLSIQDSNRCSHMTSRKDFCEDVGVNLFKTSGISRCRVVVNSGSAGGSLMGSTSFSLKLAPFVFWVNFDLISMVLDFLKEMENSIEPTTMGSGFVSESASERNGLSPLGGQGKISLPHESTSSKSTLDGNIFLPNARIILCFPRREQKDYNSYPSCNQFIAFDIISSMIGGKEDQSAKRKTVASSKGRHAVAPSCSLHLHLGDFYLFSIASDFTDKCVGSGTYTGQDPSFAIEEIASVANGTGHLSLISMFWQEDAVTGPGIAKKAKLLASSENSKPKDKIGGKGFEFASVTTVKDVTDFDVQTRQEILSGSSFFICVQLPPVTINLCKAQYENIFDLLNQAIEHFSCTVSDPVRIREQHSASQISILVECDSLTISVAIESGWDVKDSMHKELPGSWLSLTLQVDKFELLSVSDIGGIRSANFLWVAHGQGGLWGSITKGLPREFLLISCNDSTMGRGDGEGSNVLSSGYSGSDIINLWDPESNHNFTSITVRCATIIAVGGRLDWFNTIISFFSLPSSEFDQASDNSLKKVGGSSFDLNLVDVGLSYEPYFKNLMASESLEPKFSQLNASEETGELYVACLLAASSLKVSNTSAVDCTAGEYKIRLQDLGLLLCSVSESKLVGGTYSAEHLSKTGYVKVAQEAHVEALLRTNCENGHVWELECAESHIMLNTCHDTTFGFIRLAVQLQKLFAPDTQDYVVHLENRWNTAQQVHEDNGQRTLGCEFTPSNFQMHTSSADNRSQVGNFMDEVCEDVFQLDGNSDGQAKFFESHLHSLSSDTSFGEKCFRDSECLSANLSLVDGSVAAVGVGASVASSLEEKIPEFIEEYFLSDLRTPLSELALKSQPSHILYRKAGAVGEAQIGNGRWYGDSSPNILENHASKVNEQTNVHQFVDVEASSSDSKHDVGKAEGCIILKNMNVIWRIHGGSDWFNFQNTSQPSAGTTAGRDATVCFELELSGIGLDYKVYPVGEISASRLSLTINDFCLSDKSDHAPWKLVLGYHQSKKHPRKFSSKAVKLNLAAVKPDPSIPLEENRLRIALLPMRLHLHQSQLDFLINFFGGKSSSGGSSPNASLGLGQPGEQSENCDNLQGPAISEEAFLTYFQKFEIGPLLIRVDYSPCRVDLTALRGGKYVELVNLVPWKGVELQLKHVQGVGLYGWDSVCETILGEWLEDISQNQIHKLLKGLPPIKSLVAVGSGAAKLVSLPVKNYKKDHRLLKGMQRGTIAFLRSISLEAIGLGVHLAAGADNILHQAEYILTSIPPSVPWPTESIVCTNVRSNQPNDAQQGIHQAYQSISDGLGKSASALVQTPLKRYQRGAGVASALATAVQATPAAAIAPASAAARAVHCALLGFRNSLDPERKRESLEKYLGRTPPKESMQ